MIRGSKSSMAAAVADVMALVPWWAGCALALLSYLLLHRVATQEDVAIISNAQSSPLLTQDIWRTFAFFGQYLLPPLCLADAAFSALQRHRRQKSIGEVTGSKAADALDGISWQQFELLVGEAFRRQGFQVAGNRGGADSGVDLVLRKGGEKFFAQCKQWKSSTVGVTVVRELYGVMAAKGATGGFVVTSGRFTNEAKRFAGGRNVKLIDGSTLFKLIKKVQTARAEGDSEPAMQEAFAPTHAFATPSCPQCAKPMVQHTAKRANTAGRAFWGCSDYPACRGKRKID